MSLLSAPSLGWFYVLVVWTTYQDRKCDFSLVELSIPILSIPMVPCRVLLFIFISLRTTNDWLTYLLLGSFLAEKRCINSISDSF